VTKIVKWAKAFWFFWFDFVVGDDWRLAIGVVAALGLTALLAHQTKLAAWWAAPAVILIVLVLSTWRAGAKAGASE
jgi:hypothetical protein